MTSSSVETVAAETRVSSGARTRRGRALEVIVDHPLLVVFGVAIALRAALATIIFLRHGGVLFGDELMYTTLADQQAHGTTESWDAFTRGLYNRNGTFLYPLTALYWLAGTHVIVGQLFVALLGSATAVLTTRLALEVVTVRAAVFAGLAVALLPSQAFWSSLTLKDAAVWFLLVTLALLAAVLARSPRQRWWLPASGLVIALVMLGGLRAHTLTVACWALVVTAWTGRKQDRLQRIGLCLLAAVVVPWVVGAGPGGYALVSGSAGGLEQQRENGAIGAATALVHVPRPHASGSGGGGGTASVPPSASPQPADEGTSTGQAQAGDQLPAEVNDSFGGGNATGGVRGNILYLPRGLGAMVLRPYPWEGGDNKRVRLAQLETVVWYPLLLLALVGLGVLRRLPPAGVFPLVLAGAIALMWALVEGNFGTAFRHRGEFVWVVCLFAGFGVHVIASWRARRLAVPAAADDVLA